MAAMAMSQAVGDSGGGQDKADGDYDGARYYGREEAHYLAYAESLEQRRQNDVHKSCTGNAKAGVNQQVIVIDRISGRVSADGTDGIVASDKGE